MRSLESEQVDSIRLKVIIDSSASIFGIIYRSQDIYDFFEPFHRTLEKLWLKYKNVFIVGFFYAARRPHLLCFGQKAAKVVTSIRLSCHEQ